MAQPAKRELPTVAPSAPDVTEIYDEHADFVWRSLHRLGIFTRDLPDLTQEAFVVVHRRRSDIDDTRELRPWLFGICANLARNHRRKAFRRGERLTADVPEGRSESDPEADVETRRLRERGRRLLEDLDPEKRAVFVMFEVEGLSGKSIAEALGLALGTVHSRLHAARRALSRALAEEEE